jgi:hypothetical protein
MATVHSKPPPRQYGGLKDQDRIFQNLYGRYGTDLESAMEFGDWYKTREIILKGREVSGQRWRRKRAGEFRAPALFSSPFSARRDRKGGT